MIEFAKQGKIKILFDFSFEGELYPIMRFVNHMQEIGLPDDAYCALTSAGYLNGYCQPHSRIMHSPMFEVKAYKCLKKEIEHPVFSTGLTERRKFVMLNARPRPSRIMLSYLLYVNGTLGKGHCSVPGETASDGASVVEPYNFFEIIDVEMRRGFKDIDLSLLSEMHAQLPIVADGVDYINSMVINDTILSDIYDLVDFALITETMTDEHPGKVFITEKIFKAIANKVPFVVLGDIHTLKYLRDLGYKTFDFLIDESYDSMPYVGRVNAIVTEVSRLCDVNFDEHSERIKEVTDHNYSVLSNPANHVDKLNNVIKFLDCSHDE